MTNDPRSGSVREVFTVFLKLGLTSFGGPIAHLGFFRAEIVTRRRWIDDAAYADLVALCQFLPGPASSQVGFALGLARAGLRGALAAWCAFTLPSALLLIAFASSASALSGPVGLAAVAGLKLVAVAVVAQAVLGMARTLTPDLKRAAIAGVAAATALSAGGAVGQISAIGLGLLAGLSFCRTAAAVVSAPSPAGLSRSAGIVCLFLFLGLLAGLPVLSANVDSQAVSLLDAFYRSGALVFGGGHVVLPLLEAEVVPPGWVSGDAFIAGYGAAQAVPGPLSSFAAYLGFIASPEPNGWAGAAIALAAVFLPGLLLLLAALPFWGEVRARPSAQAALRGANAAVVGVLAAALYDPVWTSAVRGRMDVAIAAAGFAALVVGRWPSWLVVAGIVGAKVSLSLF